MKAYQAYGNAGRVTRDTAANAVMAYFVMFPKSRKCDVIQGDANGKFFTVKYGRASNGEWPESYKDVTKKQAPTIGCNEVNAAGSQL